MDLHENDVVQLTHDFYPQHGPMITRGTNGRILFKVVLDHAYLVEFDGTDHHKVVLRISDEHLADVHPNARV
jgi:hypothetical protein